MCGGGEAAHIEADLGEDHLRRGRADAGDLVEAVDGAECGVGHGVDRLAGGRVSGARVDGLGVGHRRQHLVDAGGEGVDLCGQGVDLVQHYPGEFGVMVVEPTVEGVRQSSAALEEIRGVRSCKWARTTSNPNADERWTGTTRRSLSTARTAAARLPVFLEDSRS